MYYIRILIAGCATLSELASTRTVHKRTKNTLLYHTILKRQHRLRAAASGYFYFGVGSDFKWHKHLVFTASVTTDSTYG